MRLTLRRILLGVLEFSCVVAPFRNWRREIAGPAGGTSRRRSVWLRWWHPLHEFPLLSLMWSAKQCFNLDTFNKTIFETTWLHPVAPSGPRLVALSLSFWLFPLLLCFDFCSLSCEVIPLLQRMLQVVLTRLQVLHKRSAQTCTSMYSLRNQYFENFNILFVLNEDKFF